jgi:hypothetical protein
MLVVAARPEQHDVVGQPDARERVAGGILAQRGAGVAVAVDAAGVA